MEEKKKVISIRLYPALWKEVKKAAIDANLNIQQYVNNALIDKIWKTYKEGRE